MKKINYPICLSASFGGAIAVFIDLLRNGNAAVTLKLRTVVADLLAWDINGGWFILIIALIPPIICSILDTPSKKEAFMNGLSVFAILNVTSPFKGDVPQEPVPVISVPSRTGGLTESTLPIFFQASGKVGSQKKFSPNARIVNNDWVSSCKPSYRGVWGLGSLLNNSIEYCPVENEHLEPGEEVRILELWDTSLRGYRYVKIQYVRDEQIKTGWIWAGQEPSYWSQILPDDEDNPTR